MNKQDIKFVAGVVAVVAIMTAVIGGINHVKNIKMEQYARKNNCTWRATGTMYGDDRDFICTPNEVVREDAK